MLNTNSLTVKLYTAMAGLLTDDTQVATDLTEMSTLGYAAKVIPATTGWSASTPTAGIAASAVAAQLSWTFTTGTPVAVLGYYVVDTATGALQYVEPFAGPKTVQTAGDNIIVVPAFSLSKL
jgi:hypothetical protein